MFKHLREDIASIFARDPAARTTFEVLTCYPGLHAIYIHKLARWFWTHGLRWLGRFTSHAGRWATGIEIHHVLRSCSEGGPQILSWAQEGHLRIPLPVRGTRSRLCSAECSHRRWHYQIDLDGCNDGRGCVRLVRFWA
jgi:hypothetical protein